MTNEEFISKAIFLALLDSRRTSGLDLDTGDIFVVWCCKTLQNSKAILSARYKGSRLYEVTYNGDKNQIYFNSYIKRSSINYDGESLGRVEDKK